MDSCVVDSDASTVPETDSDGDCDLDSVQPLTKNSNVQCKKTDLDTISISSDEEDGSQSIFHTQRSQATQNASEKLNNQVKSLWQALNNEKTKAKFAALIKSASQHGSSSNFNSEMENPISKSASQHGNSSNSNSEVGNPIPQGNDNCSTFSQQLSSTTENNMHRSFEQSKSPVFRSRHRRLSLKKPARMNEDTAESDTDCIILSSTSQKSKDDVSSCDLSLDVSITSMSKIVHSREINPNNVTKKDGPRKNTLPETSMPSLINIDDLSDLEEDCNIDAAPPNLTQCPKSVCSDLERTCINTNDFHSPRGKSSNLDEDFDFSSQFTNYSATQDKTCKDAIEKCINFLESPESKLTTDKISNFQTSTPKIAQIKSMENINTNSAEKNVNSELCRFTRSTHPDSGDNPKYKNHSLDDYVTGVSMCDKIKDSVFTTCLNETHSQKPDTQKDQSENGIENPNSVIVISDGQLPTAIVKEEQDKDETTSCDVNYSVVDNVVHIYDSDDEELFLTQSVFESPLKDHSHHCDRESEEESEDLFDDNLGPEEGQDFFDNNAVYIDETKDEPLNDTVYIDETYDEQLKVDDLFYAQTQVDYNLDTLTEERNNSSSSDPKCHAFLQETKIDNCSDDVIFLSETLVDIDRTVENKRIMEDSYMRETQLDAQKDSSFLKGIKMPSDDTFLRETQIDSQKDGPFFQTTQTDSPTNTSVLKGNRLSIDDTFLQETQVDSQRNTNPIKAKRFSIDDTFLQETQLNSVRNASLLKENKLTIVDTFLQETQVDSQKNKNFSINKFFGDDIFLRETQLERSTLSRNKLNNIYSQDTQMDIDFKEKDNSKIKRNTYAENTADVSFFLQDTQIVDSPEVNQEFGEDIFSEQTQPYSNSLKDNEIKTDILCRSVDINIQAAHIKSVMPEIVEDSEDTVDPFDWPTQIMKEEEDAQTCLKQNSSSGSSVKDKNIFDLATQIAGSASYSHSFFDLPQVTRENTNDLPNKSDVDVPDKKIHFLVVDEKEVKDLDNTNKDKGDKDSDCTEFDIATQETNKIDSHDLSSNLANRNNTDKETRGEFLASTQADQSISSIKKCRRLLLIPKETVKSTEAQNSYKKLRSSHEEQRPQKLPDLKCEKLTKNKNKTGQLLEKELICNINKNILSKPESHLKLTSVTLKPSQHIQQEHVLKESLKHFSIHELRNKNLESKTNSLILNSKKNKSTSSPTQGQYLKSVSKLTVKFTKSDVKKCTVREVVSKPGSKSRNARKRKNSSPSKTIDDNIKAAKQQKLNRELANKKPVRDHLSAESFKKQNCEDVEMPCTQDIMAHGLPILKDRFYDKLKPVTPKQLVDHKVFEAGEASGVRNITIEKSSAVSVQKVSEMSHVLKKCPNPPIVSDQPAPCLSAAPDSPTLQHLSLPHHSSLSSSLLVSNSTTVLVPSGPCPATAIPTVQISKGILKQQNRASDKKLTVNFRESQNTVHTFKPAPIALSPNVPLLKEIPLSNPENINYAIYRILSWNFDWLETYDKALNLHNKNRQLPPLMGTDNQYSRLRIYYETFNEYLNITTKLLLLEVWESIYQDWKEKRFSKIIKVHLTGKPYYKEDVSENKRNHPLLFLQMIGFVPMNDQNKAPMCGDLLKFKSWGQPKSSKNAEVKWNEQFAYVIAAIPIRSDRRWLIKNYPIFAKDSSLRTDDIFIFQLTVNIDHKVNFFNAELMEVEKISNLKTTHRQLTALSHLPNNPLCQHLLFPKDHNVYFHKHVNPDQHLLQKMNSEQAHAIAKIRNAVVNAEKKIFFLQGPAGTGKTHTILVLIHQILLSTAFKARICLATPSNAAVDEIARRIIKFSHNLKEKKLNSISVVRVGNKDSIHSVVKPYFWDTLIDCYIKKEKNKQIPSSLLKEYQSYKDRIQSLQKDLTNQSLSRAQKVKSKDDLEEYSRKLKSMEKEFCDNKQPTAREKYQAKCHVLDNAHVICGTLSSFGMENLKDILLRSEEHIHKNQTFTCLIIDEATQAIEVDSLIPLQYKVTKVVLVGDHKQLPATVKSQKANELEFGRSLFERMNDCLKTLSEYPSLSSSIMMLTKQYRMHPEILSLPNKLFYEEKLETDKTVYSRHQLLTPYLVFDIKASKELNSDRSISNVPEAICTAQLCLVVMKVLKKTKETIDQHIGIICPYAEQRQTIIEQLRLSKLEKIEVNTVDGYQGKEKEVIIMSCVRAQSQPSTIGFLADKRRMNVALTRAKYAMYVLGHFDTLTLNGLWAELHEDAQERKLIVPVGHVTDFFQTAESRITLAK